MDARRLCALAAGALVTLAVVAGLYQRAAQPPRPMEASDFARTARQLRSDALEGARLADALGEGLLTRHFALAQVKKLAEDIDDQEKDLEAPSPQGNAVPVERMLALAARLRQDLESTPPRMADRQALADVAESERRTAAEIARVGGAGP